MDETTCPCGSGDPLATCCLPVIKGERSAATAADLMRSRYTAFTIGEVDYIATSHHPETRDSVDRDEVQTWSKESEWLGLEIFDTEAGGTDDDDGVVVFTARYRYQGHVHDHVERALFRRDGSEWKFYDAEEPQRQETIRREGDKIGRNDPCPCGSGRKYKKCCGAAA